MAKYSHYTVNGMAYAASMQLYADDTLDPTIVCHSEQNGHSSE